MSILDRFFKKPKEIEPKKPTKMKLGEIERWIKNTQAQIQEDLAGEMQPAAEDILQFREEAREVVEEIRDYKPPQEIKKRMFKPVKTTKPKYVKGMLDGLGTIRPSTGESYEALVDFNTRCVKALKIIHRTQLNQGRIIATFFQEEIPRLGTALNRIMDNQKSIEEGIENVEKRGDKTSEIKALVAKIRDAKDSEKLLKKDAKEARNEKETLEEKHTKSKADLEMLQKEEDYQKLAGIENELADTQKNLAAVESKGRNLLGPLVRVLRKYVREAKDKGTKKVTESYIKNPQAALFEDSNGAFKITQILSEVISMSKRGELSIDEKEREKVENAASNLKGIKEEHDSTKKEERQLREKLQSFDIREKEITIKNEIEDIGEDILKLKTEVKDAKSDAKRRKKEIKSLKKQLEEQLSEERETDVTIEM